MSLNIEEKGFKEISLYEAQKIMLNILRDVDKICRENSLKYWIDCGTLIGAVEYKGFIPWDDDIDITMPRDDYEKFLKICQKELPSNLFLQTKKSDSKYERYFAKIRAKETLFIEYSEVGKPIEYNQGIFIDIFVVNYISDKTRYIYPFLRFAGVLFTKNRFYLKYFNIDIYEYYIRLINKLHDNKNSFIVRGVEIEAITLKKFDKRDIFPVREVKFENYIFLAPFNYDKYLREEYGDYTNPLPHKEKKEPKHSHKIYIKEKRE